MSAMLKTELIHDAVRADGWWLLVGGSEQSFVDTSDPTHLEFEYIQMMADVLDCHLPVDRPIDALHLGGGLYTVPRWVADRNPGSRQLVAERSAEIVRLAAGLGVPPGVTVALEDAGVVLAAARPASLDLLVCDVYDGPDTVTELFTTDVLLTAHDVLRDEGVYICNLSDAAPFALSQVVVAGIVESFRSVILLAEPPVMRGRRSGNLVVAASDVELPLEEIVRRSAGGIVRARVVAGEQLDAFVAGAAAAGIYDELPISGESLLD